MGKKEVYFAKLTYDGLQINCEPGFLKIKPDIEIIPYEKLNLVELMDKYKLKDHTVRTEIDYALAIKKYDILLDANTLWCKSYDNFKIEYFDEISNYTLKFKDTDLNIYNLNTYEIEEELKKRNLKQEELLNFFLWWGLLSFDRVKIEMFIQHEELIPEIELSQAEKLTESFLTTGTSTTYMDQVVDEMFEKIGYKSIISKKEN